MGGWWVHDLYQSGQVVQLISWIFWVIASIVLHELAHGWAAIWQGDDTPIRMGRMNGNPLVHMGPWSLMIFAICGIAWGMMPVDPSRFRWGRKGRIVVSAAGPAMNIALMLMAVLVLIPWLAFGPQGHRAYDNIAIFLWTGAWLNVLLALLNLLPVPPLDGANILAGLSLRIYRLYQNPQSQIIGMFIILALFVSGFGSLIFGFASLPVYFVVDLGSRALGGPALYDVIA